MDNLARQRQQYSRSAEQPNIQIKTVQRHAKITPGEKFLFLAVLVFVAVMAIKIVSAQAAIYEVNKDIQDVERTIQEQTRINDDLKIQVSELSRYERVWNKANELGLNLNENNVKVVERK